MHHFFTLVCLHPSSLCLSASSPTATTACPSLFSPSWTNYQYHERTASDDEDHPEAVVHRTPPHPLDIGQRDIQSSLELGPVVPLVVHSELVLRATRLLRLAPTPATPSQLSPRQSAHRLYVAPSHQSGRRGDEPALAQLAARTGPDVWPTPLFPRTHLTTGEFLVAARDTRVPSVRGVLSVFLLSPDPVL